MSERHGEERTTADTSLAFSETELVTGRGSLEARLMAARAKRALALAEKKSATKSAARKKAGKEKAQKKIVPAVSKPLSGQQDPEPGRSHQGLSPLAIRAAFVFVGAVGFGLGSTLAFGFMTGLGSVRGIPETEAKVVLAAPVAVEQTVLSPEKASEDMPRLVGILDKDLKEEPDIKPVDIVLPEPPTAVDQQVAMPVISKVVYMHADPDTSLRLRSLPQAPEAVVQDTVDTLFVDKKPSVFMHAPDGIPNYSLQQVVAELKQSGVEVANIGRESFRVSSTHVRYYSPATESFAMSVASRLGIEARDFSENAVNPGRIELWVAGRPKPDEGKPGNEGETAFDRARALREIR
jgi:hypothetical protein